MHGYSTPRDPLARSAKIEQALTNVLETCIDPQIEESHAEHGFWRENEWVREYDHDCPLCEADEALRAPE